MGERERKQKGAKIPILGKSRKRRKSNAHFYINIAGKQKVTALNANVQHPQQ